MAKTARKKKIRKKAKSKKAKRQQPKASGICFTIMPFGGLYDDYYETIYRQAIIDAGLTPRRADDLYRPSTIVNDIWAYTQQSKLLLADLSGKNANVFYELGLAHALAKPAILVAETIEEVPFDLRALRVLTYNKQRPNWGKELKDNITKAIVEAVGAPLQNVLPAFLSVRAEAKSKAISEEEKLVLELKRDVDLLRQQVAQNTTDAIDLEPDRIGPEEARAMIRKGLRANVPTPLLASQVIARGAPPDWVTRRIREMRSAKKRLQGDQIGNENRHAEASAQAAGA